MPNLTNRLADKLPKENSLPLRPPLWADLYEFAGFHEVLSRCLVRIWRITDSHSLAVMFTELPDNPGTSVTNFVEQLATELLPCLCLFMEDCEPESVLWIEHYPPRYPHQETFDAVEMVLVDGKRYVNPKWSRLTRTELQALGVAL